MATKPDCATYHYASTSSSVFGSSSVTLVEITNDQPTRRSFVGHGYGSGADAAATTTWDETGAAIDTHPEGAPALTVEQLFASCADSQARDPAQNQLFLAFNQIGVPVMCGFIPANCVDDCYMGYTLSDFACGPLPAGTACVSEADCGDTSAFGCAFNGAAGTCQPCGGPGQLCCNTTTCRDGVTCLLTEDFPRYCSTTAPPDGGADR
jgi:hypothetical protein